jgi:hypothetical protein
VFEPEPRKDSKGNAVGVAPPQGQIIHSAYISRFSEAIRWGCTS